MKESSSKPVPTKVKDAARLLISHGAQEVYLFGSYANGKATPGSDFDLAIKGLPARDFYRAAGEVFELLRKAVDIVDLDEDTPFTRYLEAHGAMIRVT